MRSRLYLFVLAAIIALAAPAFAQRETRGGVFGHEPATTSVTSRVFTSAVLNDPTGNAIGKVKTTTVQTTDRGTIEGLRMVISGVAPNTEFALVIDGTLIGTATSSATGVLRFKFVAPANGRAATIPDAIRPVTSARAVQIFDAATQQLVAAGQFRGGN